MVLIDNSSQCEAEIWRNGVVFDDNEKSLYRAVQSLTVALLIAYFVPLGTNCKDQVRFFPLLYDFS